jgi:hypothetical protein
MSASQTLRNRQVERLLRVCTGIRTFLARQTNITAPPGRRRKSQHAKVIAQHSTAIHVAIKILKMSIV